MDLSKSKYPCIFKLNRINRWIWRKPTLFCFVINHSLVLHHLYNGQLFTASQASSLSSPYTHSMDRHTLHFLWIPHHNLSGSDTSHWLQNLCSWTSRNTIQNGKLEKKTFVYGQLISVWRRCSNSCHGDRGHLMTVISDVGHQYLSVRPSMEDTAYIPYL